MADPDPLDRRDNEEYQENEAWTEIQDRRVDEVVTDLPDLSVLLGR